MRIEYRGCAFCKGSARTTELVHYSTRRYAHGVCLFKARGAAALDALHLVEMYKLGVLELLNLGYDVIGAQKRRKAQEDTR